MMRTVAERGGRLSQFLAQLVQDARLCLCLFRQHRDPVCYLTQVSGDSSDRLARLGPQPAGLCWIHLLRPLHRNVPDTQ